MQREDWVVIDVETTGLDQRAEIVEVAAISPRGEALLNHLVHPRCALHESMVRIHGLDEKVLASAPFFEELYSAMYLVLTGRCAIAYNAEFDRWALDTACFKAGVAPLDCSWECALTWYQRWRGFRPSLATACEVEGITISKLHRALPDALLVWRLLQKMAGNHP